MTKRLTFNAPDFESVSGREWIVTNGLGGYASSSICGANTRRYHGLLVASFDPPTDRRVLVSKVEEKIIIGEHEIHFSSNSYPGIIHPNGYQYLVSFTRMPFPESEFSVEGAKITKKVFMRYGYNTTVVEYRNSGKVPFALELTPLLVCRDYHHLFHESPAWTFNTEVAGDRVIKIEPEKNTPPFFLGYSHGTFVPDSDWYRHFEYAWEKERGLDFREDAMCIGKIECSLQPGEQIFLVFSTSAEDLLGDPAAWVKEEKKRIKLLSTKGHDSFIRDLVISGDQFLVQRASTSGHTLIAGYHWFADWGRDTMIAMRGLIIATGKKKTAKSILRTFLQYLDEGMIPNRFPDQGEIPEYNTIDASLWLFVALYEYYETFKDQDFIREVFDSLTAILESHLGGTRFKIHVTEEGLLYGGESGTQLTWMDAKVGDFVVTPRIGCPVEINALWYNALCVYVAFGKILEEDVAPYVEHQSRSKKSFRKYFINENGYLNDVVVPDGEPDDMIRPNQVYAISLPFSPLSGKESKKVLAIIKEHLYTDFGLRSLSPHDPDFKPIYTGGPWQRDNAYHQGTVWGFLWGEYALAYLKVHGYSPKACHWVREHVKAIEHHFYHEDGLWAISENFDGMDSGPGKGCIQQAWSVGMTLLALLRAET